MKRWLICRIGSLEIMNRDGFSLLVVICRIGSLEILRKR